MRGSQNTVSYSSFSSALAPGESGIGSVPNVFGFPALDSTAGLVRLISQGIEVDTILHPLVSSRAIHFIRQTVSLR